MTTIEVSDVELPARDWSAVTLVGGSVVPSPVTIGGADVFAAGIGLVSTDPTSLVTGLSLRAYPLDQAPSPSAVDDDGGGFPVTYSCPRFATPFIGTTATSPVLSDDLATVYVGTDAGVLSAVDVTTGAIAWSADVGAPVTADPGVAGGTVLVPTASGLVALAGAGCGAATCEPLWSTTSTVPVTHQPASSAGAVFVASDDGTLAAYATAGCGAATCGPVWDVDLGQSITAPLSLGAGHLFATVDGTLHTFVPAPA